MIQPDARSEQAELDRLQDVLEPPARIGTYDLTGLVARTETALIYTARDGVFGTNEGILKLTTRGYAPLLTRELALLNRCADADIDGVIRPHAATPLRLRAPRPKNVSAIAMALPFYRGGNLIDVIARRARRSRGLGSGFALSVGVTVGSILRGLLALPRPLVHGDVRPQNVLLPSIDADLTQLTLIDFDAARELAGPLPEIAADPRAAEALAEDVRGFGELLYELVSGRESASTTVLSTGNLAFDELVLRCMSSVPDEPGSYVCLADEALWRDVQKALETEDRQRLRQTRPSQFWRRLLGK